METEEESLLLADLPGVKPADVDVRFDNGELIIDGRCAPRHPGANYLLSERPGGVSPRLYRRQEIFIGPTFCRRPAVFCSPVIQGP